MIKGSSLFGVKVLSVMMLFFVPAACDPKTKVAKGETPGLDQSENIPNCFCGRRTTGVNLQYRIFNQKSPTLVKYEMDKLIMNYNYIVTKVLNNKYPRLKVTRFEMGKVQTRHEYLAKSDTGTMKIKFDLSNMTLNNKDRARIEAENEFIFSFVQILGQDRGFQIHFKGVHPSLFKRYKLSHYFGNQFEFDLCSNFVIFINKILLKNGHVKDGLNFSDWLTIDYRFKHKNPREINRAEGNDNKDYQCLPYQIISLELAPIAYENKSTFLGDLLYRKQSPTDRKPKTPKVVKQNEVEVKTDSKISFSGLTNKKAPSKVFEKEKNDWINKGEVTPFTGITKNKPKIFSEKNQKNVAEKKKF